MRDPHTDIPYFEKAFNRMDHAKCLAALKDHGATDVSIEMASAFLQGRSMYVRVGSTLLNPRAINGGSPEGSILGNLISVLHHYGLA